MDALLMVLALADQAAAPVAPAVPTRLVANYYVVGEGWGCALVAADRQSSWECWQAGAAAQAWRMPWLEGRGMVAGPDRLCTAEGDAVRCIQPPRRGGSGPRPIG